MNRIGFVILLFAFFWFPFSGLFGFTWFDPFTTLLPLLVLVLLILERWQKPEWIMIPPGSNALLLLVLLGLVQLVPLPPQLVRLLSPKAWEIYQETVGVLDVGSWLSLSLAPKATLQSIFRFVGCWAAYIAATNLLTERNKLKAAAAFMAALGGGVAAGILVLWVLDAFLAIFPSYNGSRVAFSIQHEIILTTFMVMACPLSLALFLADRPTVRFGTLKERLSELFSALVQKRYLVYGLPAVVIPLAVATYWADGLLILIPAVLLFLVFLSLRSRGRREVSYLFTYFFLVFILAVSLRLTESVQKNAEIETAAEVDSRLGTAISREVLSDFILTGAGYGTFPAISKRYGLELPTNPVSAGQNFFCLASQGGLIGLGAVGWFLIAFLGRTFPRWRQRHHKLATYLYAAGLGAVLAYTISYLFLGGTGRSGFPLLVFLLLGLVAASAGSSAQTTSEKASHRLVRVVTTYFILVAIFFAAFFQFGGLASQKLYSAARNSAPEITEARESSRSLMNLATFLDPLNPRYHYAQGYLAMDLHNEEVAMEHFADGLRLGPLDSGALYGLGQSFLAAGKTETGAKLVLGALNNDPSSMEIQSAYVDQLLKTREVTKALGLVRQFLESSPEDTLFWIQNLTREGIVESRLPQILPDRSRSYHDYGLHLVQHGDAAKAVEFFRKALALASQEKQPDKAIFLSLARFFENHQSYDDALATLLVAGDKYPEDISFLLSTARIYQQMGITFKAKQIYQKVLILDSSNEEARERLDLLE